MSTNNIRFHLYISIYFYTHSNCLEFKWIPTTYAFIWTIKKSIALASLNTALLKSFADYSLLNGYFITIVCKHDAAQTCIFLVNWYSWRISWHFSQGRRLLWLPVCFPTVPWWKDIYSIRKEFAPYRRKFFPYGVDPFSERDKTILTELYTLKVHWFPILIVYNTIIYTIYI